MKRRKVHGICLALLLMASLPAVIEAEVVLSAYTLGITPANPTSQDIVTLKLSGTWSDNCPPYKVKVEVKEDCIYLDMLMPGAEDGVVSTCKAIKTDWQLTATVGPFTPGTYKVYARGVSFTQAGGFAKIGTFQVQAPTAGQTSNPPTGTGAGEGQKPSEPVPTVPANPAPPTNPTPTPTPTPSTGTTPKSGKAPVVVRMNDLAPGVCVILMDDTLAKSYELRRGQCGTIVGREGPGHTGMVLVAWHFYGRGIHDACKDADGGPVGYPLKSARWMDTKAIRLAICFNGRGALTKGQGECVLLKAEDGQVYNLVGADLLNEQISPTGQFHWGDRVRVQGSLQVTGPRSDLACLCPQQQGDIHCPILTLAAPREPAMADACSCDKLTVDMGRRQVRLKRDLQCPGGRHLLTGYAYVGVVTDYPATLSATVVPYPRVGGTWKASVSCDDVDAGQEALVKIYVDVEGIDLSSKPAGQETVVAEITLCTEAKE